MKLQRESIPDGLVHIENVGGIDETTVQFSPGVTLLVGRNATNRTSFLQGLMAALGSDDVSVKGDADGGFVELELGEETFTRRLSRRAGSISTDGNPYLGDIELAELFAFLLDSNGARQAVARGDDLRELIMRPVDTDEIQAQIEDFVSEREELDQRLEEIDGLKRDLPGLEEERARLQEEIEKKKAELEAKEEELETADADIEETREEKAELEEELETISQKRSDLDDIRYDLETERETVDALERERKELEDELDEFPAAPAGELDDVESELERLRARKQALETGVNELQSAIGFNEEMLTESDSDVFAALNDSETGAVTDELLESGEVVCWTCGSEIDRTQIETTLDQLRQLSQKKISEVSYFDEQISDLTSQRQELEQAQRERNRIGRRLREIQSETQNSEERIDRLQEQRDALTNEIEEIEATVGEMEDDDYSAVLDLHKEANQVEYELGRIESDLDQVTERISTIEERLEEQDHIETQLDAVGDEITELRTRIERIEESAIEEFNSHMDTVLEMLDYANLNRIWIERVEREVREGRRTVDRSVFELHVVRTTESGTAYEDSVDHLSESEREVTGIVFALAGFLAHEVYEDIPFMLLDSLEAIDSDRIATLVDYLEEYTRYLLVALLPNDAAALDSGFERITEI